MFTNLFLNGILKVTEPFVYDGGSIPTNWGKTCPGKYIRQPKEPLFRCRLCNRGEMECKRSRVQNT